MRETCSNRVWSRTVSRILSVSALAWPFGVITGKCVQAPAEDSVKKYFLREAVYQRKFKAARKCIYLSQCLVQLPLLGNACFCLLCRNLLKSRLVLYCITYLVSVCACLAIWCDNRKVCPAEFN